MLERIISIIDTILINKGLPPSHDLDEHSSLRKDTGFDSFDLAELTVRIEAIYNIDIFEDGVLGTIGEILEKLKK
jgi:acyl carrier protein